MEFSIALEILTGITTFWTGWLGVLLPVFLTAKWVME